MSAFLGDLKGAAERAGVEFMTGAIALGAENKADYTRLKVKKGKIVSWLNTDYIIAADGLNSRLAESLGCNTNRPVLWLITDSLRIKAKKLLIILLKRADFQPGLKMPDP